MTGSKSGQHNDIANLDKITNVNKARLNVVVNGAIRLPQTEGNVVFHITRAMLQLLQIKGFYRGQPNEDPHDYISNFLYVCSPSIFKNIFQESIRLMLFSFSLSNEASKWLVELPMELITS